MTPIMPVKDRAALVFNAAGFRCCTLAEFTVWYEGAQEMPIRGQRWYDKNADPGCQAAFCLECHPLAQKELAAQGRCVRMDMADPQARDRMRRYRERQKAAGLVTR